MFASLKLCYPIVSIQIYFNLVLLRILSYLSLFIVVLFIYNVFNLVIFIDIWNGVWTRCSNWFITSFLLIVNYLKYLFSFNNLSLLGLVLMIWLILLHMKLLYFWSIIDQLHSSFKKLYSCCTVSYITWQTSSL